MTNEKVEISKKAFDLMIKMFTVEFEDTSGVGCREDFNDEMAFAQLYDEIRKDFPQYFEED